MYTLRTFFQPPPHKYEYIFMDVVRIFGYKIMTVCHSYIFFCFRSGDMILEYYKQTAFVKFDQTYVDLNVKNKINLHGMNKQATYTNTISIYCIRRNFSPPFHFPCFAIIRWYILKWANFFFIVYKQKRKHVWTYHIKDRVELF